MNCGKTYEDGSENLIEGCECGSSLFVYEEGEELTEDEKKEVKGKMEQMMAEGVEESKEVKFEFDLDSIQVENEGVYSINVSRLLKEIPLVIRKTEGTFHIHLPSAFNPETADISPSELNVE